MSTDTVILYCIQLWECGSIKLEPQAHRIMPVSVLTLRNHSVPSAGYERQDEREQRQGTPKAGGRPRQCAPEALHYQVLQAGEPDR